MTYNILTVIARSNFLSTDKIKRGGIELKIATRPLHCLRETCWQ